MRYGARIRIRSQFRWPTSFLEIVTIQLMSKIC